MDEKTSEGTTGEGTGYPPNVERPAGQEVGEEVAKDQGDGGGNEPEPIGDNEHSAER